MCLCWEGEGKLRLGDGSILKSGLYLNCANKEKKQDKTKTNKKQQKTEDGNASYMYRT
jgi:hypothetical protein